MDKIGVKHQLCIFHLFKMIGNSAHKILKSKNVSKREKIRLCLYFTDIKKNIPHIQRKHSNKSTRNTTEQIQQHSKSFTTIPH